MVRGKGLQDNQSGGKGIRSFPFLILLLLTAGIAAGCGGGGEDLPGTRAATVATALEETSTVADMENYARDMRDLAGNADRVNSDYRDQVERQRAGEIDTATLIERARDGEQQFQIMIEELQGVEPPAGLEEAHAQLVSALGKWLEFYGLQISGLENNDSARLTQAVELDNQAVTEASKAIETINIATAPAG